MVPAIFLSASVPDPRRSQEFAETADPVAIASAVSALVHVTLGRRMLVWGGHPAITPMIWVVAETYGVDYGSWVRLYQSQHFEDNFPEDNERFANVTFTADVDCDREKSLLLMRKTMLSEHPFFAAVFIGGMEGIVQEYELFAQLQPDARVLPIVSTGGATKHVARLLAPVPPDLEDDLDYLGLFHRHLDVAVNEQRYTRPDDQPVAVEDRIWQPPQSKS